MKIDKDEIKELTWLMDDVIDELYDAFVMKELDSKMMRIKASLEGIVTSIRYSLEGKRYDWEKYVEDELKEEE